MQIRKFLPELDVLERTRQGWTLIEVKSSTKVKPQYLPDAAVQTHVVRRAGLHLTRVEVMHLNRECRFLVVSSGTSRATGFETDFGFFDRWCESRRLTDRGYALRFVLG